LNRLVLHTANLTGADGMRALATSAHLSPNCWLSLTPRRPLGPDEVLGVRALLRRPLRRLSLAANNPDHQGRGPWLVEEVEALRETVADIPGACLHAEDAGSAWADLVLTVGD
jgi:hypothetical protein